MRPLWISGHLARVGIIFLIFMAVFRHSSDCFLFSHGLFQKGEAEKYNFPIYQRRNGMQPQHRHHFRRPVYPERIRSGDVDMSDSKFHMLKILLQNAKPPTPSDAGRLAICNDRTGDPNWSLVKPAENNEVRKKRSHGEIPLYNVCSYTNTWQELQYARDDTDELVKVYQPSPTDPNRNQTRQIFNIINCAHINQGAPPGCPKCCLAIDHSRYMSECQTQAVLVRARVHVRNSDNSWRSESELRDITINASCTCRVAELRK